MANHAALRSQNDAALARGLPYVTRQDAWEEVHSEHGVTTWVNKADQVGKVHGTVNKAPEFVLKFIVGHMETLRQKYNKVAVSTEIIHRFEEDKSLVIKAVNNYPAAGEVTIYEYGTIRPGADGAVDLVVNSPDLPEYPRGFSWLGFQIGRIEPHEGGSRLTIVSHPETTLELTDEQRHGVALQLAHFYSNCAAELNAAA